MGQESGLNTMQLRRDKKNSFVQNARLDGLVHNI